MRRPILRLAVPAAGASAFLNNTPIVAMLIPEVQSWAERHKISISKLLMPLSFAVVLGGTVTIIGTSTNLVVSGLMQSSGMGSLGFFEIGRVGLPIAVIGIAVMVILAPLVLPARRSVKTELAEQSKSFYVEMVVTPGGQMDGATVEAAGCSRPRRRVPHIHRSRRHCHRTSKPAHYSASRKPPSLRWPSQQGPRPDRAPGVGIGRIRTRHEPGRSGDPVLRGGDRFRSPLVGHSLKDVGFRSTYQAAVVAIHRDGDLVDAKLGQVRLRVGDTLIVLADPGFKDRWSNRDDFLLIASMDSAPSLPVPTSKALLAIGVLAAIVLLAVFNVVPILVGALVGAVALVTFNVISSAEARRSVDLEVVVIIAAAFGLAAAMETSGLAQTVANGIVYAFGGWGDRGTLLGIILATVILTEMITNNAAALLMFPIGITIAANTDLSPVGVAIAIAVAASASFLTPIGYQTNTMVYGPGGYRFGDYARLGLPLTIIVVSMLVWLVPIMWT